MTDIEKATTALVNMMEAEHIRLRDAKASYQDLKRLHSQCNDAVNAIRRQTNHIQRWLDLHPDRPVQPLPPPPSYEQQKLWRKAEREKRRELKQEAELQQRLIDAGYRAMAARAHPDAGGSHDDMLRLNEIRDRLKKQPIVRSGWRMK